MNYEFGRLWKKVAVTDFKVLAEHLLGGTVFPGGNKKNSE
jgi:hypothetical protein